MNPGDIRNDLLRIVTSQFTSECINAAKAITTHCESSSITAIKVKELRKYLQRVLQVIPGNTILQSLPNTDTTIISIFRESLRRFSFDLDRIDETTDEWLLYKFLQLGDAVVASDLINTGGYPFPDPRKFYEQVPVLTELALANVGALVQPVQPVEPVIVMGVKASTSASIVEAAVEEVLEEVKPTTEEITPEKETKQDMSQRGRRR